MRQRESARQRWIGGDREGGNRASEQVKWSVHVELFYTFCTFFCLFGFFFYLNATFLSRLDSAGPEGEEVE